MRTSLLILLIPCLVRATPLQLIGYSEIWKAVIGVSQSGELYYFEKCKLSGRKYGATDKFVVEDSACDPISHLMLYDQLEAVMNRMYEVAVSKAGVQGVDSSIINFINLVLSFLSGGRTVNLLEQAATYGQGLKGADYFLFSLTVGMLIWQYRLQPSLQKTSSRYRTIRSVLGDLRNEQVTPNLDSDKQTFIFFERLLHKTLKEFGLYLKLPTAKIN